MIRTIEKYYCDICEKEVAKGELKLMWIPCHGDDGEGRISGYDSICLDLCDKCTKRLYDSVFDNFAEIHNFPGGYRIMKKTLN